MHEKDQNVQPKTGDPSPGVDRRSVINSQFDRFEKRQKELWRFTFAVLFVLAVFFAWTSWASIRSFATRYEALAHVLIVVVIALFGAYVWKKSQEISELRNNLPVPAGLSRPD
jgi:magnesium-transporting ATPase (P-type)